MILGSPVDILTERTVVLFKVIPAAIDKEVLKVDRSDDSMIHGHVGDIVPMAHVLPMYCIAIMPRNLNIVKYYHLFLVF